MIEAAREGFLSGVTESTPDRERGQPARVRGDLTVEELFRLEPRLVALESEVDAIRDDGVSPWFCSNFLWLPVNTRLRLLVGVARLAVPGTEDPPELYDSRNYEHLFEHLSRRLPPCRACGCRRFERLRASEAQASG